jgi:hypothetical protein
MSNPPSFEDSAVMRFFETSTRHLVAAEAVAGVAHHVALSVVGTERLPECGYCRAKIAQEQLIEKSLIPYSIGMRHGSSSSSGASPTPPPPAARFGWRRCSSSPSRPRRAPPQRLAGRTVVG